MHIAEDNGKILCGLLKKYILHLLHMRTLMFICYWHFVHIDNTSLVEQKDHATFWIVSSADTFWLELYNILPHINKINKWYWCSNWQHCLPIGLLAQNTGLRYSWCWRALVSFEWKHPHLQPWKVTDLFLVLTHMYAHLMYNQITDWNTSRSPRCKNYQKLCCMTGWRIVCSKHTSRFLLMESCLIISTETLSCLQNFQSELAQTKVNSDFQQVPLHVKVADATSVFGIYVYAWVCITEREALSFLPLLSLTLPLSLSLSFSKHLDKLTRWVTRSNAPNTWHTYKR